jgi:hypothetical protein
MLETERGDLIDPRPADGKEHDNDHHRGVFHQDRQCRGHRSG